MKKNSHGCSICNQRFSRRGNAERHNELKHDDLATISDTRLKSVAINELQSKNRFNKNNFKQMQLASTKGNNDISDEFFSEINDL